MTALESKVIVSQVAGGGTASPLKVTSLRSITLDELVKRGEKVYTTNCAGCHQPTGKGVPPAFPALDGSAIVKGPKEKHLAIVINGKPGTAMAAFGAQLNDADIASVVAYERNAWSNKLNDVIQPAEVKALRGK